MDNSVTNSMDRNNKKSFIEIGTINISPIQHRTEEKYVGIFEIFDSNTMCQNNLFYNMNIIKK